MPSEFFPLESLKSLIAHHIAILERYDVQSDKEFSLIYFDFGKYKEDIEIKKTIQTIFRDCDIIFEVDGDYIILLPKTNWQFSFNLLKELQEFLNKEVKDTIVTYPDDGKNAEEIVNALKKIVLENHDIELKFK
jgi:hypothetical protein